MRLTGGAPDAPAVKAELRRVVLARRDAIPAERRRELSAAIFARITSLPAFERSATVLAYSSFGSEPATDSFIRIVLDRGKVLALPRVSRATRTLELYGVQEPSAELESGVFGIREPIPAVCPRLSPGEVDFVLVPGVAFDARGGRIGYGGGYYDRLLDACAGRPALVAAAFETQLVDEVPMGPGDRRVDLVVTEGPVYRA